VNGADVFKFLLQEKIVFEDFDWLENRTLSDVELLLSVVLTQNTNWNNVLKALENLKQAKLDDLEQIAKLENTQLALLIKPSGFYNTKAKRLLDLIKALLKDFKNLENFKAKVSREWLLQIKGLGYESADSILNYLCQREILVVDSYSKRLALALGYEFEHYEQLREFFECGVEKEQKKLCELLGKKYELYELYQIFHALIIAFCKEYFKGKKLDERGKKLLENLKG